MQDSKVYCVVRKKWVSALSEEIIRQAIILKMTQELGYSLQGFALEIALHQLPHLAGSSQKLPQRRADIVYYTKEKSAENAHYPLLLIECKAVPLNPKVIRQVVGYNYYVQARYIAIANEQEIQLGWKDKDDNYAFIHQLPTLQSILSNLT